MSFFNELRRRNVIRVGIAYLVASWLLLQILDVVVPILFLPDWVARFFFLVCAAGFLPALIFAWAFEMTPEGLKRESEITRDSSITHFTAKKLDRITIALLLVIGAIVVIDWFLPETATQTEPASIFADVSGSPTMAEPAVTTVVQPTQTTKDPSDTRKSIAVLPFVNMSDDKENEYFSDGISEELLNVLVRIKSLRVPSRTSSFTFKDSNKKLSEIGRELQVDHILEGSVRKSGNRIRVTAQLIDVNTDTHLWSDSYTRELDDIFAVQDEIAQAIVGALQVTLSGADQKSMGSHSTSNVEAYNLYLLGRHLWHQRTDESLMGAIEPLEEAVALDPDFDRGWAALADAYVLIPEYGLGAIDNYIPKARDAAARSLAIHPESARALTTRAYIKWLYDYDWQGSDSDFRKAIELNPSYATAHQWYGEMLSTWGR